MVTFSRLDGMQLLISAGTYWECAQTIACRPLWVVIILSASLPRQAASDLVVQTGVNATISLLTSLVLCRVISVLGGQ